MILAVEFGPPFDADPDHRGASRRWTTEGVEGCLRRLPTDRIDVHQVGVPDPDTDLDETLGALTDLVRAVVGAAGRSAPGLCGVPDEKRWTDDRRPWRCSRLTALPYG